MYLPDPLPFLTSLPRGNCYSEVGVYLSQSCFKFYNICSHSTYDIALHLPKPRQMAPSYTMLFPPNIVFTIFIFIMINKGCGKHSWMCLPGVYRGVPVFGPAGLELLGVGDENLQCYRYLITLQSGYTNFYSHQQSMRAHSSPPIHHHWGISDSLFLPIRQE